jgi:hypothetical protein
MGGVYPDFIPHSVLPRTDLAFGGRSETQCRRKDSPRQVHEWAV